MVLGDGPGAIELLSKNHSDHPMRQGEARNADESIGIGLKTRIEAVSATNDKNDVATVLLPVAEVL